jgi:hypothetical protein
VRSVSRRISRVSLLAACGLFLIGAQGGCATTQETAARKQAEAKRILEKREHRRGNRQADRARSKER